MVSVRGEEGTALASEVTGVARSTRVESAPLRSFLRSVDRPRLSWADRDGRVAAGGATATIASSGQDRFETVQTAATDLFEGLSVPESVPGVARPRLFGGFAFHDGHSRPSPESAWYGYPGALFVLPSVQVTSTAEGTWITTTGTGPHAEEQANENLERWSRRLEAIPELTLTSPPVIAGKHPIPSLKGWQEQVTAAINKVKRGTLRKVVLAQSLGLDLGGSVNVPDALARLAETYPDCYRFLFQPRGGRTFYGATPERLVTLDGQTVKTEALAGSTGRGETVSEDEWLASDLRDSEKDRHEHELVVEAIRGQLDPLASSVRTGSRRIRQLATVQHLQTPIRADLTDENHVLSLVEALHPTPAVGGLPPDAALETIRETEAFSRGWYASPVGWIDEHGDGTFAVGIRSALAGEDAATLFAGAGIVADSDPEEEWDELQLKYGPMLDELE